MNGVAVLVVAAALGVDYGWQRDEQGELEYIIQIEPALLANLQEGEDVLSQIHPDVRGVRRFRIRVGDGDLPRSGAEPPNQPPATDVQPDTGPDLEPDPGPDVQPEDPPDPEPEVDEAAGQDDEPMDRARDRADEPAAELGQPPSDPLDAAADDPLDKDEGPSQRNSAYSTAGADPDADPAVDSGSPAPPDEPSQPPEDQPTGGRGGHHEPSLDGASRLGTPLPLRPEPESAPLNQQTGYAGRARIEAPPTEADEEAERGAESARDDEEEAAEPQTEEPQTAAPAPTDDAPAAEPPRPWLPLTLTALALFASLGANLYLGWLAWSFLQRYRRLAERLRPSGA